jgi:hypothetical protein
MYDKKIENKLTYENFYNIESINKEYNRLQRESYRNKIKDLAIIALDKKFENEDDFQYDLLSTEDKYLIWNDEHDAILGMGNDGKGENFVGKYLMELREKYKRKHEQEFVNPVEITSMDVERLIKNRFIRKFIDKQIMNICKFVVVVKKYKTEKNLKDIFEYVFEFILNKCSKFANTQGDIPNDFYDIVNKQCVGCIDNDDFVWELDDEIVGKLWGYIWSMILIIINHVNTKSQGDASSVNIYNISKVIKTVQDIQTLRKSNVENIIPENDLNPIVNCIINIVNTMNCDKNMLQKSDIEIAASIILGIDIRNIDVNDILTYEKSENIENVVIEPEEVDNDDDEEEEQDYDDELGGVTRLGGIEEDGESGEEEGVYETQNPYVQVKYDTVIEEESDETQKIVNNLLDINTVEYKEESAEILSVHLQTLENFKDSDCKSIAVYILQCSSIIKNYNKMFEYVKRNRLNFFA